MICVENPAELNSIVVEWKKLGLLVGFVPTMGFLHRGHLALIHESCRSADKTVASIFVNPRQFGPTEDLEKYPRDIERDAELAKKNGVDILFLPPVEVMYPEGYQTNVSLPIVAKGMCGSSRPGHFDGVATVITKLFNLVQPDIAIFGEKDFQQLALIRQLTIDLNFNIKIIGHPIVREDDGLAMSSRNKYLSRRARKEAVCLHRSLLYGVEKVKENGGAYPAEILKKEIEYILTAAEGCRVDYISIVDSKTLNQVEVAQSGNVLALAVYFEEVVRLIDNITL